MENLNEYEIQANDFLAKTNTTFKTEFVKYGKLFENDEQERNIFKITLSNKNGEYSFNFGASIVDSCNEIEKPITEVEDKIEVYAGMRYKGTGVSCGITFYTLKSKEHLLTAEEITKYAEDLHAQIEEGKAIYNAKMAKKYNRRGLVEKNSIYSKKTVDEFVTIINKAIKRATEKTVTVYEQGDQEPSPTAYDVLACLTSYEVGTFEDFCGNYGYDEDSRSAYRTFEAVTDEYKNVAMLWDEASLELLQEIN